MIMRSHRLSLVDAADELSVGEHEPAAQKKHHDLYGHFDVFSLGL